ncbi:hypothetical protein [Marivivens marinus]|uniref:hypothetical protein n=1 Tax=Marivivens marinus TaxID=3110173 RepID=UPI003B848564
MKTEHSCSQEVQHDDKTSADRIQKMLAAHDRAVLNTAAQTARTLPFEMAETRATQ